MSRSARRRRITNCIEPRSVAAMVSKSSRLCFPEERRRCLRSRNRPICKRHKTFFQYGNDAATQVEFRLRHRHVQASLQARARQSGLPPGVAGNRAAQVQRRSRARSGCWSGPRISRLLMRAKSARSKGNHTQAIELCEDAFVNNPWDVGAARVAAEAAEGLGLLVLAQWFVEIGAGGDQGRRLLQVRRPHSRGQRKLAEGDRLLGAGQEAQPQRPGRQPPDQRAFGGRHDQAGRAGRRPGQAGGRRGRRRAGRGAGGQARAAQARAAHARSSG